MPSSSHKKLNRYQPLLEQLPLTALPVCCLDALVQLRLQLRLHLRERSGMRLGLRAELRELRVCRGALVCEPAGQGWQEGGGADAGGEPSPRSSVVTSNSSSWSKKDRPHSTLKSLSVVAGFVE